MTGADDRLVSYRLDIEKSSLVIGGVDGGAAFIAEIGVVATLAPLVTAFCTELGKRFGGTAYDWISRVVVRGSRSDPERAEIVVDGVTVVKVDDSLPDEAKLALRQAGIANSWIIGYPLKWDRHKRLWVPHVTPVIARQELGRRLLGLRENAGLTAEQAAERLTCPVARITRLENGQRRPLLRDVKDLCAAYDADPADRDRLMDLARTAQELSSEHNDDDQTSPYALLELDATSIYSFASSFMPALLQTEDYARAILAGVVPRIIPEVIDERVTARMNRQQLLERAELRYRVILDEAVLCRKVGGAAIMEAQISRILELERIGKVAFQILPFESGFHGAVDSNFVILDFGRRAGSISSVVFSESLIDSSYRKQELDVLHYHELFDHLRDVSLNRRDSLQSLIQMRELYSGK